MKTKSMKSINQCKSVIQTTNDIVKAHGGRLDINSTPGEKNPFTINLEKKI
jgi:hypothetical protein